VSAAALDAYRGFWTARIEANAHPTRPIPAGLDRYAVDTALANDKAAIILYRQQGIEFRGAPELNPRVEGVTIGDPSKVNITDCVDATRWVPVFAATGKPAQAPGQPTRLVIDSLAMTLSGRWVIRTFTVHRDRPC
jgi:hypothetical protein